MTNNIDFDLYERTIETKDIYEGRILRLQLLTVELPNGEISTREVIRHNGACAVLAIKEGKFVIVKQFRKALDETLLEIPAGKIENDEDPALCAMRELEEETGYRANSIHFLMDMYSAAGYSSERIHIFYADDLQETQAHPDEDEFLSVHEVDIIDFYRMILNGKIKDSKTICAVLKYAALKNISV